MALTARAPLTPIERTPVLDGTDIIEREPLEQVARQ